VSAEFAAQAQQNTISRFGLAIDAHDLDGVLGLFTDDATIEIDGRPGPQKGHHEIRQLFAAVLGQGWQGQHNTSPAVLTGHGDEAEFVATYTYLRFEDGFRFQTAGRYEGILRRDANGADWRFARLGIRVLARG
jgi:ketosteroid isomerase-like protein